MKQKTAILFGENKIRIEFPFDMKTVDQIKTLPDRRFNPDGKFWVCPITSDNLSKLQEWGFQFDDFLQKLHEKTSIKVTVNDVNGIQIPGLKGRLFPFQSKGVSFIEAKNGRALIADEMGLGKTVQALAWLQLQPELRPAIIVVPASLKLNWQKEAEIWMSEPNVEILSGTKPWKTVGDILIINYDVLSSWVDQFKAMKPSVLIMDECHYIKNNSAQRTKALKKLAKGIPHIIGLSGTPIMNRPVEIDNAIRLIDPMVLPSFWSCAHKFYGAKNNGYGWNFSGATNTETFHKLLSESVMIRRKKMDVLTDLPEKIYSFVPIELENKKEYESAESNFLSYIKDTKGQMAVIKASNAEMLTKIETLKQLAVAGKMNQAINWIKDFLESDQKLVVFATHKTVIDSLMEAFPGISIKIDGSVENTKRQDAVDQFQNNPKIRLFVGNIQAAGVGITLTTASNVVFLELPWTPGALVQAADRCHRIGQKDNVVIHYLLAVGTIEEKIALMLDRKRKVLNKVLDGIETDQDSLLSELINEYK
jgi:SWI/SNF-related matrix-associated actin-dependent regulator 1 of chromatin subfamily A